ncbi:hypothetical protein [Rhizobium leguminosarum]|uniref:hypothetical protein n=1 Tax=Rhizobium leguminosarum TaxID=384 RepID=UPI001FDF1DDE|nr:hypothetical protein [Rhizobium leguminosarum]
MNGKSLAKILQRSPFCVFCGGQSSATTVEHMPSRVIFDGKQRPRGMEFPSCEACQQMTRKAELVIGLLSRIYPDPTVSMHKDEIRELFRSVSRNIPGLLQEMYVDQLPVLVRLGANAFKLPSWDFLDFGGPIISQAIDLFGFKLGAALHFELTGRIVPAGGGVWVNQYSNADAHIGELPDEILHLLGPGYTLRMGRQNVEKQFRYQSAQVQDIDMTVHFAVFREAFALLMVVYTDGELASRETWKDDIIFVGPRS